MLQLFFYMLSTSALLVTTFNSALAGSSTKTTMPRSWSDVSYDRRCEGLLDFFKIIVSKDLPGWTLKKPQCVASGVASGDSKWVFQLEYSKGAFIVPLKYVIDEVRGKKPQAMWCQFKGDLSGCATPWDNGFFRGDLFTKAEAAKAAYESLLKKVPGLLSAVTHLDAWISLQGDGDKIFDESYDEWVGAFVKTPRRLPLKDGEITAEFYPRVDNIRTGTVSLNGVIAQAFKDCMGCGKTPCEKSPITFEFYGLGLSFTRRLTPEEQKTTDAEIARAFWVLTDKTPYSGVKAKWPFMCGEHRYNIQKI